MTGYAPKLEFVRENLHLDATVSALTDQVFPFREGFKMTENLEHHFRAGEITGKIGLVFVFPRADGREDRLFRPQITDFFFRLGTVKTI